MGIGSAPCDEECVSVNPKVDYLPAMRQECLRFMELIRKKLGPEPERARLTVKSNPHDFGAYLEVVCYYDDQDEEARGYAYRCESEAPMTWDDDGQREKRIEAMANAASPQEMVRILVPSKDPAPPRPAGPPVCDSCLAVAYSQGADDRLTASEGMVLLGDDLEDHSCDARTSPGLHITCQCACNHREVKYASP
ncbi:MAG: hypothetical protein HY531_02750 [Chloroflexi bacterium]|nr:hypothetical protein [Chloroflexota bacterium]